MNAPLAVPSPPAPEEAATQLVPSVYPHLAISASHYRPHGSAATQMTACATATATRMPTTYSCGQRVSDVEVNGHYCVGLVSGRDGVVGLENARGYRSGRGYELDRDGEEVSESGKESARRNV